MVCARVYAILHVHVARGTCSMPLHNVIQVSWCLASPSPQDTERQVAKSFRELSTEEVCQWFTSIGLQKCIPFIKGKTPPSHSHLCEPRGCMTAQTLAV